MKASKLKPGDVMDGWTVVEVDFQPDGGVLEYILLELEGTYYLEGHDVNGEEIWWLAPAPEGEPTKTKTRRTWYRADEDVEVRR